MKLKSQISILSENNSKAIGFVIQNGASRNSFSNIDLMRSEESVRWLSSALILRFAPFFHSKRNSLSFTLYDKTKKINLSLRVPTSLYSFLIENIKEVYREGQKTNLKPQTI